MTVEEFEATRHALRCHHCGRTAALEATDPNIHNQIGIRCGGCGSMHALGRVEWLRHTPTPRPRRKAPPMGKSLAEILPAFKFRCAVCCANFGELLELGIGATLHHVTERYDEHEYDCPVIPVCSACKLFVDAQQRNVGGWVRRIRESKREPVPPSRQNLSPARVSPDSVRAQRQTPVGVLEGIPDDDADH